MKMDTLEQTRTEVVDLNNILQDERLCGCFRMFLEDKCAEENLLFWVDVSRLHREPPQEPSVEINRILTKYFRRGSTCEINISHNERSKLTRDLENNPEDITAFDKIQRGVEKSMDAEFLLPFLSSKYYADPSDRGKTSKRTATFDLGGYTHISKQSTRKRRLFSFCFPSRSPLRLVLNLQTPPRKA
jgi:hypothetical protein